MYGQDGKGVKMEMGTYDKWRFNFSKFNDMKLNYSELKLIFKLKFV